MTDLRDSLLERAHNANASERIELAKDCLKESLKAQAAALNKVVKFYDNLAFEAPINGWPMPEKPELHENFSHDLIKTSAAIIKNEVQRLSDIHLVGAVATSEVDINGWHVDFLESLPEMYDYAEKVGVEGIYADYASLVSGFKEASRWTLRADAVLKQNLGIGKINQAKAQSKERISDIYQALDVSTEAIKGYYKSVIEHYDELAIKQPAKETVQHGYNSYLGIDFNEALEATQDSIEDSITLPEVKLVIEEAEEELDTDVKALGACLKFCKIFLQNTRSEAMKQEFSNHYEALTQALEGLDKAITPPNKDSGRSK